MHKMWRLNEAGPADGRVSPGATLDQVVDRILDPEASSRQRGQGLAAEAFGLAALGHLIRNTATLPEMSSSAPSFELSSTCGGVISAGRSRHGGRRQSTR